MPIGVEGLTQTMMWGDGYGVSRPDLYVTSLMDFHRGWRTRANEMSETVKLFTMLGTYIHKYHGTRYYGKAMNITRRLTAHYDTALATHDLLLMPTTPIKATPLPPADASRELYVERALNMISNTATVRHHPSPGDGGSVRHVGRPAGVNDADRQAFRRTRHLSRRLRIRALRRLDEDVAALRRWGNPYMRARRARMTGPGLQERRQPPGPRSNRRNAPKAVHPRGPKPIDVGGSQSGGAQPVKITVHGC